MKKSDIAKIELDLLLEAVYRRYGYDFSHYAHASLKRRINHFTKISKCENYSELIPRLLHDKKLFQSFLSSLSITVTEMFRDPSVYKAIRQKVVPVLKTYPFVKIWHAGCATGEEVYSLAIILHEEDMLHRTQIYATDINDHALKKAKSGIYPISQVKDFTKNYQGSGGKQPFTEYHQAKYDSIILSKKLRKNIVFANHNLATDAVFGEMHLIMCRNVLIYFDTTLQDKAIGLFNESLVKKGFLCLGSKESIRFSKYEKSFRTIAKTEKIFQKQSPSVH